MLNDPRLIDRIYQASVIVEDWPDLLQHIADHAGAKGCVISMRSPAGVSMIASPKVIDDVNDFLASGWAEDTAHTAPLFAELWPGFRTETDYRTAEELAALPVHAEFLDRRGYIGGLATVVQGAKHDAVHLALEGFPSHGAARAMTGTLDNLRPHLARAISLTALRRDNSKLVTESFALAGVAAAVIGREGKLRAANGPFALRMGNRMIELPSGLKFTDPFLSRQVDHALERQRHGVRAVQSVPVRDQESGDVFAIHLLPIVGAARAACGADGILLLIADPNNVSIPSADLLRLLFDLTPSQARVARALADGQTLAEAAAALTMSQQTARTHLKVIFAKIGVNRQSDLVRILVGLAAPQLGPGDASGSGLRR